MNITPTKNTKDTIKISRIFIYLILIIFAIYYLLPLYVMLTNSLKPLEEIRAGGMLNLPSVWTLDPWRSAWSTAQIGVDPSGLKPYFWNSISMVIPAVILTAILGAMNGYVLTKWQFKGHGIVFGMLLLSCFIPFQIVLIPMAKMLGILGMAGTTSGLVFVHLIYGLGFTTLFFRNYYVSVPTELVKAARIDGAGFFKIFFKILLPISAPIIVVTVIWQFTQIWNDFLFGSTFSFGEAAPIQVALNNMVLSSTSVKEYNVDMASAIIAGIPTLIVYVLAGKYFIRGLTSGAVKG